MDPPSNGSEHRVRAAMQCRLRVRSSGFQNRSALQQLVRSRALLRARPTVGSPRYAGDPIGQHLQASTDVCTQSIPEHHQGSSDSPSLAPPQVKLVFSVSGHPCWIQILRKIVLPLDPYESIPPAYHCDVNGATNRLRIIDGYAPLERG